MKPLDTKFCRPMGPSPWHLSGHGPAATGDEVQTGAVAAVELGGGLQVAETWWAPKIHATEKTEDKRRTVTTKPGGFDVRFLGFPRIKVYVLKFHIRGFIQLPHPVLVHQCQSAHLKSSASLGQ